MLFAVATTNPIAMSCLMGCLYTLAPDHIGTLVALTAGVSSLGQAFFVGVCWGVGHSMGMALVFLVFVALRSFVNTDSWEIVGNYCAGSLMVLVGLYFLACEAVYLEQKEDGSFTATPCSCSSAQHGDNGFGDGALADERGPLAGVCSESRPLLQRPASLHEPKHNREVRGTVLGLLHGLCCPSCLLGVSFAGRMTTQSYGPAIVALFVIVFVLASALGTGLFAVSWTMLVTRGAGSCLSPKLVYRGSCIFTLSVGVCWITANYFGFIGFLDFADHVFEMGA